MTVFSDIHIIEYVLILLAVVFMTVAIVLLTYHVVLIYIYAIAISSLYFSKKSNIMTTILSVIGVSIGQLLGFTLRILPDKNFRDIHGLVRILQSRSPQHRRKMQPGSEKSKRWYARLMNWQEPCRQDLHPRKKVSKINKIQSEKFLKEA